MSIAALLFAAVSACAPNSPREGNDVRKCLTECTSRMGVVSAFGAEADILLAETSDRRTYKINGNLFTTGILKGNRVVIVLTGVSIANATMITQLMIDHFNVHHLLLTGIAGGVNPSNHIGDVIVPEKWSMPMEVYWNGDSNVPSPCGATGDLLCLGLRLSSFTNSPNSDYQTPTRNGQLGLGLFMRDTYILNNSNAPGGEYKFDYNVDAEMLAVAKSISPQLDRCGPKNTKLCVSAQPRVRFGGRGISAPMFLANPHYRDYLFKTIQAQLIDMETAAFAHVAYANQIPFIAFRSLSDLAGAHDFTDVGAFFGSGLAESNEARVTLSFLEAWAKKDGN